MKASSESLGNPSEGERRKINQGLWHACAGPLVSIPPIGTIVVYFPQGHSEQVAASMGRDANTLPCYPSLPSKLICLLQNVVLHADNESDEVYAEMTLQPVSKFDREALLASDLGMKQSKQPSDFFCKTLTASDTSTHGGFSVPRRAAEKIFPPLDFSTQPPAQELCAKDLHDASWTFRHIYRGQPKRHLLTTGWSVFVSAKKLLAGDSVLFVRDEKSRLLLGVRRAARQPPSLSSSVLSSESMQIGILAAAAHAAANNSPFTIFYNPRSTQSEFVVPLAKYQKAVYMQVAVGVRFRMMFETEESGIRRFMGTITGISDLDPERWYNSPWRNLQVDWDESTTGEKRNRVSLWEIEPVVSPFYLCPPSLRSKIPIQPGILDGGVEKESGFKAGRNWQGEGQGQIMAGLNLMQWMGLPQGQQSLVSSSAPFHNADNLFRPQPPPTMLAPLALQYPQQPWPQPINQYHQQQQIPARHANCPVGLLDHQSSYFLNQSPSPNQASAMQLLHQQQQALSQLGPNLPPPSPPPNHLSYYSPQMQPLPSSKNLIFDPRHDTTDHPQASSSATSLCVDGDSSAAITTEDGFPQPPLCLDQDMASGLVPDALFKSFSSSRELHGLLTAAGYVNPRDDSEITSQSRALWMAQQPRMRTFTKVQKRGSVGRSVDVNRYRGYGELRRDLAAMFGLEGQLEDPQRTDWKLVYVDHENDILLVGDDPWEEFVSCVQSIKILSAGEVQQMSLDNLVGGISENPASSGSDSQWRTQYDDTTGTSFGL